jgi:hypothetical protein
MIPPPDIRSVTQRQQGWQEQQRGQSGFQRRFRFLTGQQDLTGRRSWRSLACAGLVSATYVPLLQ